jgi:single-stranded DNA-binding protein
VNAVSLIGTIAQSPGQLQGDTGERLRFQVAVPRRSREGQRLPGVVYVGCILDELDAHDWSQRLSTGMRVGLAGRLDVDEEYRPDGWHRTHAVLVDQLDYLGPAAEEGS